jgi:hypothetical protein
LPQQIKGTLPQFEHAFEALLLIHCEKQKDIHVGGVNSIGKDVIQRVEHGKIIQRFVF